MQTVSMAQQKTQEQHFRPQYQQFASSQPASMCPSSTRPVSVSQIPQFSTQSPPGSRQNGQNSQNRPNPPLKPNLPVQQLRMPSMPQFPKPPALSIPKLPPVSPMPGHFSFQRYVCLSCLNLASYCALEC